MKGGKGEVAVYVSVNASVYQDNNKEEEARGADARQLYEGGGRDGSAEILRWRWREVGLAPKERREGIVLVSGCGGGEF